MKYNFYLNDGNNTKVTLKDFPNLAKVYSQFVPLRKTSQKLYKDSIKCFYTDDLIKLPIDYYAQIYSSSDELQIRYDSEECPFMVLGYNSNNKPIVLQNHEQYFSIYQDCTDERFQIQKLKCLHPYKNQIIQKDLYIGCLARIGRNYFFSSYVA